MQRKEVTFASGTDTCAAWLYAPAGGGSVPEHQAVVVDEVAFLGRHMFLST